jgi:hypothetical protein
MTSFLPTAHDRMLPRPLPPAVYPHPDSRAITEDRHVTFISAHVLRVLQCRQSVFCAIDVLCRHPTKGKLYKGGSKGRLVTHNLTYKRLAGSKISMRTVVVVVVVLVIKVWRFVRCCHSFVLCLFPKCELESNCGILEYQPTSTRSNETRQSRRHQQQLLIGHLNDFLD